MGALGFGASLTLRPGGRARGFDFGGGVLPPGASLTRASPAMRTDAAGVLASVAANAARFDHHPATLAARGLLIEPAATNELLHSAQFDAASWSPAGGVTVTANAAAAPDGAMTGDIVTDPGASYSFISQMLGSAVTRRLSFFIARDAIGRAARFPMFRTLGTSANDLGFDTATGAFNAPAAITDARADDLGGYWRVSFTAPNADRLAIFPAYGASAAWAASPGAAGAITVWGMQAETGPAVSSPIPTEGAAATRAADILVLGWGALGVANGAATIRYIFDDLTTQDVATTIAGGAATVPTNLARPWLRRAERV